MSFIWNAVSVILGMELILLLFLCLPLPWGVRKNVSRWLFRIKARQVIDSMFKYILFALFLALAESLYSLRRVYVNRDTKSETDSAEMEGKMRLDDLSDFRLQKARSERNMYLASFAITSCMAIVRLVRLAAIEVHLRDKIKYYNGDKAITEFGEIIEEKKD